MKKKPKNKTTTPCPFPRIVNGYQEICCEFYSNGA